MFYFCRCWATRVSIQMQMSCRCCSRQLLRPLAEGERAGRAAGTATLLRAGAIHTKLSGPPGPCKGGLFGLVVCKRLCSPPAPPESPKRRDISSFLLPPAVGCPNATAPTRRRAAPCALTAPFQQAGAAQRRFGGFSHLPIDTCAKA